MKYYTKSGLYKASNVIFDPSQIEAYSYNWWSFVKVIENKVVFNNFPYSNTTRKHQYKVENLMNELGIEIDLVLAVRDGLQTCETLADVYEKHAKHLRQLEKENEAKRLKRNEKAKQKRLAKKLETTQQGA